MGAPGVSQRLISSSMLLSGPTIHPIRRGRHRLGWSKSIINAGTTSVNSGAAKISQNAFFLFPNLLVGECNLLILVVCSSELEVQTTRKQGCMRLEFPAQLTLFRSTSQQSDRDVCLSTFSAYVVYDSFFYRAYDIIVSFRCSLFSA